MLTGKRRMRQLAKAINRLCRDFHFQIDVLLAQEERDPRQPIFSLDGFAGPGPVLGWKNPRSSCELWASDVSTHSARRDANFGIISDSFVLAGVAARHHVKLVIPLAEPDWGVDRIAVLAEAGKRDVLLSMDLRRDRHDAIVRRGWCGLCTVDCVDAGAPPAWAHEEPLDSTEPLGGGHRSLQSTLEQLPTFAGGSPATTQTDPFHPRQTVFLTGLLLESRMCAA